MLASGDQLSGPNTSLSAFCLCCVRCISSARALYAQKDDSGLRQHRRCLLQPFSAREKELKSRSDLQPWETEEFHILHRLFTGASELGSRIWEFQTSRSLAEHLQISEHVVDSVCGPVPRPSAAERSRSRSPFPDFPSNRVADSEPASSSANPSSGSVPRPTVELIQEHRAEDAAHRLLENLGMGSSGNHTVCLFDFNGVINDSWHDSVRVLGDLKEHGVKVGVLSYCRKPDTVSNTFRYLQDLSEAVDLDLPVVISPRPVSKDCWAAGDWCKADLILELPISSRLTVCFIDDRRDICQDCSRQVSSPYFRVIQCSQGIVSAVAEWTVWRKGTHYLDLTDIRTVRIC